MYQDVNLINQIINTQGVSSKADLIKSALNKEINHSVIKSDFEDKAKKSDERFEKAKQKFYEEKDIYEKSEAKNAEDVLEKHIKSISTKLESLGF